jgi:tetratricopeptide (TPR) repeat protein
MESLFQSHDCLSEADIQAYLSGALSQAELFRLENHLLDCPLCEDAVEGFALIQVPKILEEDAPVVRRLPWLRIAAGFLILLSASLFTWNILKNQAPGNEQLYAANFESYASEVNLQIRSLQPGEMAPVDDTRQAFNRAMEAYNAEDFQVSLVAFDEYLTDRPQDALALFYLGMAYLELDQPALAVGPLRQTREADTLYYEEATWYLALAHIKLDNSSQALVELKKLLDLPESRYHKRAKILISKL